MNIVDRYPHKRLTAEYYKRYIPWNRMVGGFQIRVEREQSMAYMELGSISTARYAPGRENIHVTFRFDITGLEPREIESMLFSEYDDIEFINPETGKLIKLIGPNIINGVPDISYEHGITMGRDYSNIIKIEMIVNRIE
jgi:hypothetical protein